MEGVALVHVDFLELVEVLALIFTHMAIDGRVLLDNFLLI